MLFMDIVNRYSSFFDNVMDKYNSISEIEEAAKAAGLELNKDYSIRELLKERDRIQREIGEGTDGVTDIHYATVLASDDGKKTINVFDDEENVKEYYRTWVRPSADSTAWEKALEECKSVYAPSEGICTDVFFCPYLEGDIVKSILYSLLNYKENYVLGRRNEDVDLFWKGGKSYLPWQMRELMSSSVETINGETVYFNSINKVFSVDTTYKFKGEAVFRLKVDETWYWCTRRNVLTDKELASTETIGELLGSIWGELKSLFR